MQITINFAPNKKQSEVLASFYYDKKADTALMLGGVRAGKTTLGHQLCFMESVRYEVPVNVLVARATHDEAVQVNAEHFFRMFKKEDREVLIEGFNKKDGIVTMPNGSKIYFWGLGKEGEERGMFEKIESMEFSFAFIDDARRVPSNVFNYIQTRMSGHGTRKILLSTNPPPPTHWLYREFVTNRVEGRVLFHFSLYDNQENLPADFITRQEKLPPSYRKVFVDGDWGNTWEEGGVFQNEFNYEVNVDEKYGWDDFTTCKEVIAGIDFGFHFPACGLIKINYDRTYDIFYELLGRNMGIFDFFQQIINDLSSKFQLGARNVRWYGDIAGNHVNSLGESDFSFVKKRFGINIIGKKIGITDSIMSIRNMLVTLVKGRPQLGIHPSCESIVGGFLGGYRVNGKGNVEKDPEFKDIMDAVRYALVNYTPYVDNRRSYDRGIGRMPQTPSYRR